MKKEIHKEQKTHLALLFSFCFCLLVTTLFVDQVVAIKRDECTLVGYHSCTHTMEGPREGGGNWRVITTYIKDLCSDPIDPGAFTSCKEWRAPDATEIVKKDDCESVPTRHSCIIEVDGRAKRLETNDCHVRQVRIGFFVSSSEDGCLQWLKLISEHDRLLDETIKEIEEKIKKSREKDLTFATNILGKGSSLKREPPGTGGGNVTFIITFLTKIILAISSTTAVVLLVLYGVRLIYSQHIGKVAEIKSIEKSLINVGFGMLMLLLSFLIFQFIDPNILNPTLIFGS